MTERSDSDAWPQRIAVIGAGGTVGSATAYTLAAEGIGRELNLIDVNESLAQAHVIDVSESQTLAGVDAPTVTAATVESAGEADLVVVAASLPVPRNGSRSGSESPNVELFRRIAADVAGLAGENGIVLVVSNPVDLLSLVLHRATGMDPSRIIGYNLNDTVRLRRAIARELEVPASAVSTMMLGEHGKRQVPLFDQVTVNGARVTLDVAARRRITSETSGWFARWSALQPGRSSGWSTSRGVAHSVGLMRAEVPHPAAAWVGDLPFFAESFVTVPITFRAGRVSPELDDLGEGDLVGVREAAALVAEEAAKISFD